MINDKIKVLNLYAGLGGNRKLWENVEVTAVEADPKIANLYKKFHPEDKVVVGDAHEYLVNNLEDWDFIWSSPPCQSHSKMVKATRHKRYRYPDMSLYEEIILLRDFSDCKWVVENVVPYYGELLPATKLGRHLVWSNFEIDHYDVPRPSGFINKCNTDGKKQLMDWLDIHYEENVYYGNNHCPAQILRNCVHPKLGKHIFESAYK